MNIVFQENVCAGHVDEECVHVPSSGFAGAEALEVAIVHFVFVQLTSPAIKFTGGLHIINSPLVHI